jgi:hypothetical protein
MERVCHARARSLCVRAMARLGDEGRGRWDVEVEEEERDGRGAQGNKLKTAQARERVTGSAVLRECGRPGRGGDEQRRREAETDDPLFVRTRHQPKTPKRSGQFTQPKKLRARAR